MAIISPLVKTLKFKLHHYPGIPAKRRFVSVVYGREMTTALALGATEAKPSAALAAIRTGAPSLSR
jgi:hypothetical protein